MYYNETTINHSNTNSNLKFHYEHFKLLKNIRIYGDCFLAANPLWLRKRNLTHNCRQPSAMSNASRMLQILDLRSLVRLAGCEQ